MSLTPEQTSIVNACLDHRVMMRLKGSDAHTVIAPPVTMQPSHVAKASLDRLSVLQVVWSDVVDVASRDIAFLESILGTSDQFASDLLAVAKRVYPSALPLGAWPQSLMLGIFRSDYMRTPVASGDAPENEWRHVEINTISCSFAGLSSRVGLVHQQIATPSTLGHIKVSSSEVDVPRGLAVAHDAWLKQDPSRADWSVPKGNIVAAATSSHTFTFNPTPIVVFVVQEGERNFIDQRLLMESLRHNFGVESIRLTLRELHERMELTEPSSNGGRGVFGSRGPNAMLSLELRADDDNHTVVASDATMTSSDGLSSVAGPEETIIRRERRFVSVFYFRSTYDANDFTVSDVCWPTRERIERSSAVKCPTLLVQLFGMKRVQLALSRRSVLSKFLKDESFCDAMLGTVVGQFLITDDDAKPHIDRALRDPHSYVLKTQKEGFGKLYTDGDVHRLLSLRPGEPEYDFVRSDLLLMERIRSRTTRGAIWRQGQQHDYNDLALELGTFGVVLSDGRQQGMLASHRAAVEQSHAIESICSSTALPATVESTSNVDETMPPSWYINFCAGYLARTKSLAVEGGGVMSGIAALDALSVSASP